jgi:hypothetical protein
MENFAKGLTRNSVRCSVLLLPLLLSLATAASASDESTSKPTDVPAVIIAHLPLPQATGSQMLLQRQDSKQYLYVQQASKQGFMIVDVSKPEHPSLLKRTAESNQSTAGHRGSPRENASHSDQHQPSHRDCAIAGLERPAQSQDA